MKTKKQCRQGDIMLEKIEKLPAGAKRCKEKDLVVGSSTGHKHALKGKAEKYKLGERIFVKIIGKASLIHDEHKEIELSGGIYELIRQREFDPIENRTVQD